MEYTYGFEKLDVWQPSRALVKEIYIISKQFPADEKFGLTRQLRRSAVSVSSNIAKGSTRWSKKDQARFYEIAFGSLIEVLNHLILACDLEYLDQNQLKILRPKIESIGKLLNALHRSTIKGIDL